CARTLSSLSRHSGTTGSRPTPTDVPGSSPSSRRIVASLSSSTSTRPPGSDQTSSNSDRWRWTRRSCRIAARARRGNPDGAARHLDRLPRRDD
ncbi:MAG: hypothetical protein AVDCRST_MAG49-387, partial [uncultured Thermomicrobiales bacterium]